MKPKEQFALVLRVLAVLGLMYLVRGVVRHPAPDVPIIAVRVVCVIVGLYLLRGAPLVVNFAYPEDSAKPNA